MKRNIIIFTGYYVPYMGGLSSHAHEFDELFSQKNYKITVFTSKLPSNAPEIEKINDNLQIIRFEAFEIIPNYPLPKFWKYSFWKQYFTLFKTKPDFIISRIRFFNTSILALIYSTIKRVKRVHIEHTSNHAILSSKTKTTLAKYYDQIIGRLIFKTATINISISKAVHRYITYFDKRHSPIIYRGLNLKELSEIQPDTKYKEKYKNKTIITIASRLYKWKGIHYTIQAIEKLPREIKEKIIFLIIGDGEDFEELSKHQSDHIKLLGRKTRKNTISILKISDIYVHSSMPGGGLSTSLLEAMHSKCAVIATPNEGADEVIIHKKNGILVNKPYPDTISKALIKLLQNPQLQKELQKEAQQTVQNKFDWNKSIEKYENIFDEMCD